MAAGRSLPLVVAVALFSGGAAAAQPIGLSSNVQQQALTRFLQTTAPSNAFYLPTAGPIVQTPSDGPARTTTHSGGTWVVVTEQINDSSSKNQAVDDARLLGWNGSHWALVSAWRISAGGEPKPGAPIQMGFAQGLAAIGVPLNSPGHQTFAFFVDNLGTWSSVGFDQDTRISHSFKVSSESVEEKGSTIVRQIKGCLRTDCSTLTITYTFSEGSNGVDHEVPILVATGLSGPSKDFVNS
jgi:hypothetical protein